MLALWVPVSFLRSRRYYYYVDKPLVLNKALRDVGFVLFFTASGTKAYALNPDP